MEKALIVHRWGPRGYLVILTAGPGEVVRAEPFEATELRISVLFGIEDEEEYSRELAIVPSFELVEFAD